MSVTVKVPAQLRALTGGASKVDSVDGLLVDVIDDLERRYPGFRAKLLDDDGRIRRFVNIYVDEEDVRFLDGLSAEVKPGTSVAIVPAVAGGAAP